MCGQHIDGADQLIEFTSALYDPRIMQERCRTHTAIKTGSFGFAEWCGAGVIAIADPRTIVRAKEHEGVLGQAMLFECTHHLPHGPIDFHHDIAIETDTGLPLELVAHKERHVRHGMGQIKKEGLLLIAPNEIY